MSVIELTTNSNNCTPENREIRTEKCIDVDMRIGIHSGMVLSGIIGVHKWQFDIWSEDSILASAMEHDGVPGCVHITKQTRDFIPAIFVNNFIIQGTPRVQDSK